MNCVTGSEKSIKNLIKRLNPTTESMEGAAVFYASKQLNIDCLQIRSISNYVEPRNKDNWKIGLAIKNLNDWAIAFVGEMNWLWLISLPQYLILIYEPDTIKIVISIVKGSIYTWKQKNK